MFTVNDRNTLSLIAQELVSINNTLKRIAANEEELIALTKQKIKEDNDARDFLMSNQSSKKVPSMDLKNATKEIREATDLLNSIFKK